MGPDKGENAAELFETFRKRLKAKESSSKPKEDDLIRVSKKAHEL